MNLKLLEVHTEQEPSFFFSLTNLNSWTHVFKKKKKLASGPDSLTEEAQHPRSPVPLLYIAEQGGRGSGFTLSRSKQSQYQEQSSGCKYQGKREAPRIYVLHILSKFPLRPEEGLTIPLSPTQRRLCHPFEHAWPCLCQTIHITQDFIGSWCIANSEATCILQLLLDAATIAQAYWIKVSHLQLCNVKLII